jgi:GNAT superfamily N-acetyltransferase
MEYRVRRAESDADLRGILSLQAANHRDVVASGERASQGFVSLRHDFALLREMNAAWGHVVAVTPGAEQVVGYALTMEERFRHRLPLLEPMFERIERLSWRGRPVREWRWYVMGQVCVAKEHRGQGLVEAMYAEQRRLTAAGFDLVVTEISRLNPRSLRAHERAGWDVLDVYTDAGEEWVVVGHAVHDAA